MLQKCVVIEEMIRSTAKMLMILISYILFPQVIKELCCSIAGLYSFQSTFPQYYYYC